MTEQNIEAATQLSIDSDASSDFFNQIYIKIAASLRLYRLWWKELALGVFIRVLTLIVILLIANINPFFPDINDMNELLTKGILYMFQGQNPYNRDYWLTALALGPSDLYYQDFLNYGPMSLIIHLPCMVYPYSFDFAGYMDFQPSFMVLHGFFDFLIFDRMMRRGNRPAAMFVWINPIMVTLNFVTHMSVVLFFLWMGYEKWKDPFWSIFWLGIGAITYQYIGLLLLFAIIYHIRSYQKWIRGVVPAVVIFAFFQGWASLEAILYNDPSRNMALIYDLLLVQFSRGYEPWPLHIHSWWSWTGSIPAVLFNAYWIIANWLLVSQGHIMVSPIDWVEIGDPLQVITKGIFPPGGLRISTIFSVLAVLVTIYLLLKLLLRPDYIRSLKYGVIAIGLFLIGAPAGIWHHNFIIAVPAFFYIIESGAWLRLKKSL